MTAPNHKQIAILAALPEELSYFLDFFAKFKCTKIKIGTLEFHSCEYRGNKILISCTGIGTTFAASAMTFFYDHFHPDYVFFSGSAGAINPELHIRDVVIAEKAFEAEIQDLFKTVKGTPFENCLKHPFNNQYFPEIYSASPELLNIANSIESTNTKIIMGTVVTSNLFPAPQILFSEIKNKNPLSIDMETSAIYQIAWLFNIPTLAIRGISNILNHDGTDDRIHESDLQGASVAAAKVVLQILDKMQ